LQRWYRQARKRLRLYRIARGPVAQMIQELYYHPDAIGALRAHRRLYRNSDILCRTNQA
jgi:hypothetical protein